MLESASRVVSSLVPLRYPGNSELDESISFKDFCLSEAEVSSDRTVTTILGRTFELRDSPAGEFIASLWPKFAGMFTFPFEFIYLNSFVNRSRDRLIVSIALISIHSGSPAEEDFTLVDATEIEDATLFLEFPRLVMSTFRLEVLPSLLSFPPPPFPLVGGFHVLNRALAATLGAPPFFRPPPLLGPITAFDQLLPVNTSS